MRPLRNKDPEAFRIITIRTSEARLWITLSGKVKKLIGGIIARYQELLGIELYAYCVLGNHLHLLARAPNGNIDEFCENVNREIARRLNWRHKRAGKFWARRYDDEQILSEEDLIEAFLYIITNPSRHGLIKDGRLWPGLNSYEHALNGRDRKFGFQHYSDDFKVTFHTLKLSVLPPFRGLSKSKRRKTIEKLLLERLKVISEDRGGAFMGLDRLFEQSAGEVPNKVSSSPRPSCYTKFYKLRREFLALEKYRREVYDDASARYRLGLEATFPPFTFKPPLHRLPRIIPFTPMTPEDFKKAA